MAATDGFALRSLVQQAVVRRQLLPNPLSGDLFTLEPATRERLAAPYTDLGLAQRGLLEIATQLPTSASETAEVVNRIVRACGLSSFLGAVHDIAPISPSLLVDATSLSAEELRQTAAQLVDIVETTPEIDASLVVSHEQRRVIDGALSHGLALVAESTIEIAEIPVNDEEPRRLLHDSPLLDATILRSQAERIAREKLESNDYTRGCFEPNAKLDTYFGTRLLEVDFLDRRHGIAFEIDGYYHFLDKDGWRRDRRKDLILQQLGYHVVRLLAEDVTDDPDVVLRTIVDVVLRRENGGR